MAPSIDPGEPQDHGEGLGVAHAHGAQEDDLPKPLPFLEARLHLGKPLHLPHPHVHAPRRGEEVLAALLVQAYQALQEAGVLGLGLLEAWERPSR